MKSIEILLMRHGNSDYNIISRAFNQYSSFGTPFYKYLAMDSMLDSGLSLLGKLEI